VESLIAASNEADVFFERHVGFALLKAFEITDDCGANVGSMRLRFQIQIDLSEEIDGVGHGVHAIRIEHRVSLAKHELEMVIVLVVVIRPSGSIESEVDGGVVRSESPRKVLECRNIDRIDHFSKERELSLVDVLGVVVPNNLSLGAIILGTSELEFADGGNCSGMHEQATIFETADEVHDSLDRWGHDGGLSGSFVSDRCRLRFAGLDLHDRRNGLTLVDCSRPQSSSVSSVPDFGVLPVSSCASVSRNERASKSGRARVSSVTSSSRSERSS
jgi:hypothetical protein